MANQYTTSFVNLDNTIPSKNAIMFFPQEWQTLINCLPLINYYHSKYIILTVVMRADASNLVNFYTSQFNNVKVVYYQKNILDYNFNRFIGVKDKGDILFFGDKDSFREDKYANHYRFINTRDFSLNRLYETYNIKYSERIHSFSIDRNYTLEKNLFDNLIEKNEQNYIVVDPNYSFDIPNTKTIYLNDDLPIFFDYIKVLEKAKEIYLTNSPWAYICYLLDSKYEIFRNIKVNLLCEESNVSIFTDPKQLNNWIIKIIKND